MEEGALVVDDAAERAGRRAEEEGGGRAVDERRRRPRVDPSVAGVAVVVPLVRRRRARAAALGERPQLEPQRAPRPRHQPAAAEVGELERRCPRAACHLAARRVREALAQLGRRAAQHAPLARRRHVVDDVLVHRHDLVAGRRRRVRVELPRRRRAARERAVEHAVRARRRHVVEQRAAREDGGRMRPGQGREKSSAGLGGRRRWRRS